VPDATCAGCGCLCDDIELTEGRPVRTCPLGDRWFAERSGDRPPVARVDGAAVSLDEAVDAAAAILTHARAPLVTGLGQTSIEAQRRAVALAEAAGGVVDVGAAAGAFASIGSSTATFGEIRDRSELVVLWRADPAVTHPRLLERLRLDPAAMVVVDAQRTATAEAAGEFVEIDAARDFEILWELRAGIGDLAERLQSARHVAFIHGPLDELTGLALASLVRDLARDRHAVTLRLRGDGNERGAEDVVAWQTGFAAAVSFARGHPVESPGAAELLEGGDVDAALVVAADPLEDLPGLRELPLVVIDARATATSEAARVAFATAADGIEVAGTAHRMDGVPVPLRAPQPGERPSAEDVLAAIEGRL
jgi:formylmethanofuran dehydrogenase subunit B